MNGVQIKLTIIVFEKLEMNLLSERGLGSQTHEFPSRIEIKQIELVSE